MRDFLSIMQEHSYFRDERWNKSNYIYTFETGSQIEFFSSDQPRKVRGPRRDRLFLNEANNVEFESFEQLEVRTKEFIFLDYNPVSEFWFHTEIIGVRDDAERIILTYKDNEALDPRIIASIEQRMNRKGWWTVYGEGQLGEVEGKIYSGWQIIDEVPHEARLERRGLDFGYSCLTGETIIETSTGKKEIKDIKKGEFVLTRKGLRRVLWSGSRGTKEVYALDFGLDKHIIATGDHLIYTLNGWKQVSALSSQETICELRITSANHVLRNAPISFQRLEEKREVFDLTIEGEHEFFANGVLVHNCDPTAVIDIYKYNGGYILDEVLFQTGLLNRQIYDSLSVLPKVLTIADSAEPKSIEELSQMGLMIIGANKGQGSVSQGIQYVQSQRISMTKRSVNLIKAYRNYLWQVDKNGKILNEPDHAFSDCLDAVRYGFNGYGEVEPQQKRKKENVKLTKWG